MYLLVCDHKQWTTGHQCSPVSLEPCHPPQSHSYVQSPPAPGPSSPRTLQQAPPVPGHGRPGPCSSAGEGNAIRIGCWETDWGLFGQPGLTPCCSSRTDPWPQITLLITSSDKKRRKKEEEKKKKKNGSSGLDMRPGPGATMLIFRFCPRLDGSELSSSSYYWVCYQGCRRRPFLMQLNQ